MKTKYLVFLLILVIMGGCNSYKRIKDIYRRINLIVYNKFPIANPPTNSAFEPWKNSNMYILRVKLEEKNKILYSKNGENTTELTDYPLKDYKLLTEAHWDSNQIVEEVYIYLSDFEGDGCSGKVLYMSSMPLLPHVSRLVFCNSFFVSTYGVNHLMTGTWERNESQVKLKLSDNSNTLDLTGVLFKSDGGNVLEFTHVNHPKPLKKNDKGLIEIGDVFELNSGKHDSDPPVKGIRFFQNKERTFVHPDWSRLGKRFDSIDNKRYYEESVETRKITKVMIGKNGRSNTYFMINDSILRPKKKNLVVRYRR